MEKTKLGAVSTKEKRRKLFVSTAIKQDLLPGNVGDQRRTADKMVLRIQRI